MCVSVCVCVRRVGDLDPKGAVSGGSEHNDSDLAQIQRRNGIYQINPDRPIETEDSDDARKRDGICSMTTSAAEIKS